MFDGRFGDFHALLAGGAVDAGLAQTFEEFVAVGRRNRVKKIRKNDLDRKLRKTRRSAEFVIDAEFAQLIPPLSQEAREGLEKSLQENGFDHTTPFILWKGHIVRNSGN